MNFSDTEYSDSIYNYIDAIFQLQSSSEIVISTDIASCLNVSKPSVCEALKKLTAYGLIVRAKRTVRLSETGLSLAQSLNCRYNLLRRAFGKAGIKPETADEDARKLARTLSSETFEYFRSAAGAASGSALS